MWCWDRKWDDLECGMHTQQRQQQTRQRQLMMMGVAKDFRNLNVHADGGLRPCQIYKLNRHTNVSMWQCIMYYVAIVVIGWFWPFSKKKKHNWKYAFYISFLYYLFQFRRPSTVTHGSEICQNCAKTSVMDSCQKIVCGIFKYVSVNKSEGERGRADSIKYNHLNWQF